MERESQFTFVCRRERDRCRMHTSTSARSVVTVSLERRMDPREPVTPASSSGNSSLNAPSVAAGQGRLRGRDSAAEEDAVGLDVLDEEQERVITAETLVKR